jgi:putative metallohydrolase (TIGR04338 family)
VPTRDFQRSRVYKAEQTVPKGKTFSSLEDTQQWVNAVMTKDEWIFPIKHIKVRDGRSNRSVRGKANHGNIWLPQQTRYEMYVLHELTHAIKISDPCHGEEFCGIFLYLVEKVMGSTQATQLKRGFDLYGVKVQHISQ